MVKSVKSVLILALGVTLAACGARAPLEPLASSDMTTTPFGESERPDAEQLLELPTLAAPERSVELRRRSEEREDDPFDLPPD
ncbi:hypothetical protein [uncultured Erythrobacter sp.]|uniref:hypothetical protein n=1 Tax=uncultured Erythrobacter sp. TaxID=263913 RepID=UPI00261612FE|nr:hypothetical protein [uncultured Erythrobacter sp.]